MISERAQETLNREALTPDVPRPVYRDSNPKVDLYSCGRYLYSTNQFRTCKDANQKFLGYTLLAQGIALQSYVIQTPGSWGALLTACIFISIGALLLSKEQNK